MTGRRRSGAVTFCAGHRFAIGVSLLVGAVIYLCAVSWLDSTVLAVVYVLVVSILGVVMQIIGHVK